MFGRGAPAVRPLRPAAADAALRLALRDPLTHALPGARLADVRRDPAFLSREFSALGPDGDPHALLWNGANTAPIEADGAALDRFAEHLTAHSRSTSSLVGPSRDVARLWDVLAPVWGAARDYRWSQPLLEARADPSVAPEAALRPARPGEEGIVFPAAVAMFREEVGNDPTAYDGGRGYRRRVGELIAQGRTYVIVEDGAVVFKADVGALFGDVAQLHGVWVRPGRRGEGIARRAMAAVVEHVRRDHAPRVSLYVNDFNEPARRAYAVSGFVQAGELATLLF
ncbi:GNAT family N-acetyltransferase [Brachybacterium huguangmaarense]